MISSELFFCFPKNQISPNNPIFRDSFLVPIINCGTSVFAGFVIFSVLGFMAHEKGVEVKDVAASGMFFKHKKLKSSNYNAIISIRSTNGLAISIVAVNFRWDIVKLSPIIVIPYTMLLY